MKLRINNNSIRLRLSQSEVETIGQGHQVTQVLNLGKKQVFHYELIPSNTVDIIVAKLVGQKLEVHIPLTRSKDWAMADEVTLRHVQDEGTEHESILLIEKDFQCLHQRPDEDESDNFPNPKSLKDYENCE